jgi:energy-coupling factor transporter ATP-binding protein EcfA2
MMQCYSAYGLTIESEIALPYKSSEPVSADVSIRRHSIDAAFMSEHFNGGSFVCGYIGDGVSFFSDRGRTVGVDEGSEGVTEGMFTSLLTGTVMAAVLRQRGFLALHASSVSLEGGAIGFMGHSGWGKSTLASAFYTVGHKLINDDILALDKTDEGYRCLPGFPQVKLRPDIGEKIFADFDALPSVHDRTDKRISRLVNVEEDVVPLRKLYVVEPASSDSIEIIPISSQDAIVELLRHTRVNTVFRSARYIKQHLDQCAHLIANIPIAHLKRPKRLDALADVRHAIEEDIRSSQGQVAS